MRLEQTCSACPEQYDVYHGKLRIGYLRLRHGYFAAYYPNCGGEVVYEANTKGDGIFEEDEREFHLNKAKEALRAKLKASQS